ncbi:MAG: ribonuclease PH [Planctomycetaceae bacterium]|nr:ribonuclease PH [Planctomycetaceae bacterium]
MTRPDGRLPNQLRPIAFERGFTKHAEGSVLVRFGETRVLCTVFVEDGVPRHRLGKGGWLTAEYDMLPGSTSTRKGRSRNKMDGRSVEIQRLIGRSLRSIIDINQLAEVTLYIDCDVLQADGGTRTAAITGAYVALCDALTAGAARGLWGGAVRTCAVAAVSVGILGGRALLDLDYAEDASAEVDANLVMNERGEWIEVQATAEQATFAQERLDELTSLGRRGIEQLFRLQQEALR